MSEMVDRVAKAIFRKHFHPDESGDAIEIKWLEWDEERLKAFAAARAAIAAMREPTEAVLYAGTKENDYYPINLAVWQAMIDEALR